MTVRTRRRCSRDLAGGEEDVEGFGRGDEDVRRVAEHGGALFGEGVAGADAGADFGGEIAACRGRGCWISASGPFEVLLDVVGEGFEGRDVDDLRAGREVAGDGFAEELVDADEKCGESFSGAGGGGDEGGVAGEDGGPAVLLGLGGGAEFGEEPLGGDGVRPGEGGSGVSRGRRWMAIVARLFVLSSPRHGITCCRCLRRRLAAAALSSSRYCFDDLVEDALGVEDEVDGVAAGSVAAGVGGDVVGHGFDLGAGVGGGDGEAAGAHDGEVDDVVADVGEFVDGDAGEGEDLADGVHLVGLALVDELQLEVAGADGYGLGLALGDDADADAGEASEGDAEAVVGGEAFDFDALCFGAGAVGDYDDLAVGEDAVYVEDEDFDLLARASGVRLIP